MLAEANACFGGGQVNRLGHVGEPVRLVPTGRPAPTAVCRTGVVVGLIDRLPPADQVAEGLRDEVDPATERFQLVCSLNRDYIASVVRRRVEFSPDAVRQLRALRTNDRGLVKEQIREQLGESDATQDTRNRFRLRRPSRVADYELRIRDWRVFYRVVDDAVQVALIGRKRGNFLIIDRKRFIL